MLNKKLLAVAVLGTLAAGNAVASDLSAPGGAIPAYFAKEIIATTAAPRTLTTSASSATQLNWDIGYNFSVDEVRYARVECSSNLRFGAGTSVSSSDAAAASIGAINGLSTNVITFSLTSNNAGNLIADTDVLTVSGDHAITGTDAPVNCTVGLYAQPSQAQAGGNAGLIAGSSFSGAYLAFVPSYQLTTGSTEHVADGEADPSFSEFVPDVSTGLTWADIGWTPAAGVVYGLRDPDGAGPQTAPFRVDGTPITMADLFAPVAQGATALGPQACVLHGFALEAAEDLYANEVKAFARITFPLTLPGIVAGSMLVFVPSLGAFVTPDLLGGARSVMIGNVIQSQFLSVRDYPFGSAFSFVLMAMMLLATLIYFRVGARTA